jgi:medium-chain acyl-[acyl-carrier-protein] hydrolase
MINSNVARSATILPTSRSDQDERWFVCRTLRSLPRQRLFALPYAGGNGAVFRTWGARLPEQVELYPVELPGRWGRLKEPPLRLLIDLVEQLGPVISNYTDLPYTLLGYSFGGLLIFELARWLRRHNRRLPDALFVLASPAPTVPRGMAPLHNLGDMDLIEAIGVKYAPLPAAVLADPDLRALFLRALRADLSCIETYRYVREDPLPVPIHVYGGLSDASIPKASLEGWATQTSCDASIDLLPGGHFFIDQSSRELFASLGTYLR